MISARVHANIQSFFIRYITIGCFKRKHSCRKKLQKEVKHAKLAFPCICIFYLFLSSPSILFIISRCLIRSLCKITQTYIYIEIYFKGICVWHCARPVYFRAGSHMRGTPRLLNHYWQTFGGIGIIRTRAIK